MLAFQEAEKRREIEERLARENEYDDDDNWDWDWGTREPFERKFFPGNGGNWGDGEGSSTSSSDYGQYHNDVKGGANPSGLKNEGHADLVADSSYPLKVDHPIGDAANAKDEPTPTVELWNASAVKVEQCTY